MVRHFEEDYINRSRNGRKIKLRIVSMFCVLSLVLTASVTWVLRIVGTMLAEDNVEHYMYCSAGQPDSPAHNANTTLSVLPPARQLSPSLMVASGGASGGAADTYENVITGKKQIKIKLDNALVPDGSLTDVQLIDISSGEAVASGGSDTFILNSTTKEVTFTELDETRSYAVRYTVPEYQRVAEARYPRELENWVPGAVAEAGQDTWKLIEGKSYAFVFKDAHNSGGKYYAIGPDDAYNKAHNANFLKAPPAPYGSDVTTPAEGRSVCSVVTLDSEHCPESVQPEDRWVATLLTTKNLVGNSGLLAGQGAKFKSAVYPQAYLYVRSTGDRSKAFGVSYGYVPTDRDPENLGNEPNPSTSADAPYTIFYFKDESYTDEPYEGRVVTYSTGNVWLGRMCYQHIANSTVDGFQNDFIANSNTNENSTTSYNNTSCRHSDPVRLFRLDPIPCMDVVLKPDKVGFTGKKQITIKLDNTLVSGGSLENVQLMCVDDENFVTGSDGVNTRTLDDTTKEVTFTGLDENKQYVVKYTEPAAPQFVTKAQYPFDAENWIPGANGTNWTLVEGRSYAFVFKDAHNNDGKYYAIGPDTAYNCPEGTTPAVHNMLKAPPAPYGSGGTTLESGRHVCNEVTLDSGHCPVHIDPDDRWVAALITTENLTSMRARTASKFRSVAEPHAFLKIGDVTDEGKSSFVVDYVYNPGTSAEARNPENLGSTNCKSKHAPYTICYFRDDYTSEHCEGRVVAYHKEGDYLGRMCYKHFTGENCDGFQNCFAAQCRPGGSFHDSTCSPGASASINSTAKDLSDPVMLFSLQRIHCLNVVLKLDQVQDTPNLTHNKRIDWLGETASGGGAADNNPDTDLKGEYNYRLYLDLTAKTEPTDLLIVVDRSNSMGKFRKEIGDEHPTGMSNPGENGFDVIVDQSYRTFDGQLPTQGIGDNSDKYYITRFQAVMDFLNDYRDGSQTGIMSDFLNANEQNRLAVISFSRNERNILETTSENKRIVPRGFEPDTTVLTAGGDGWASSYQEFNLQTIEEALAPGAKSYGGSTNYCSALMRADNLLNHDDVKNNNKVVVFLSDGAPTRSYAEYYNEPGRVTNDFTGNGNGEVVDEIVSNDTNRAIDKFCEHQSGVKIYSVAFHGTVSDANFDRRFLGKMAQDTDGKYFDAESAGDLRAAINKIFAASGVSVSDTLSGDVKLLPESGDKAREFKITRRRTSRVGADEYTVLYDGSAFENGGGDIFKTPPVSVSGKTVKLNFKDDYTLRSGETFTLSFNIEVEEATRERYNDYQHYTDNGDEDTDYPGGYYGGTPYVSNSTSSSSPGFHSNTEATLDYSFADRRYSEPYSKPVVQCGTDPSAGNSFELHKRIDFLGDGVTNEEAYSEHNNKSFYRLYLDWKGAYTKPFDLLLILDTSASMLRDAGGNKIPPEELYDPDAKPNGTKSREQILEEVLNGSGGSDHGLINDFLGLHEKNRVAAITFNGQKSKNNSLPELDEATDFEDGGEYNLLWYNPNISDNNVERYFCVHMRGTTDYPGNSASSNYTTDYPHTTTINSVSKEDLFSCTFGYYHKKKVGSGDNVSFVRNDHNESFWIAEAVKNDVGEPTGYFRLRNRCFGLYLGADGTWENAYKLKIEEGSIGGTNNSYPYVVLREQNGKYFSFCDTRYDPKTVASNEEFWSNYWKPDWDTYWTYYYNNMTAAKKAEYDAMNDAGKADFQKEVKQKIPNAPDAYFRKVLLVDNKSSAWKMCPNMPKAVYDYSYKHDTEIIRPWSSSRIETGSEINLVVPEGVGTNYDAALKRADEVLKLSGNPNKIVLFITDGVPTYWIYEGAENHRGGNSGEWHPSNVDGQGSFPLNQHISDRNSLFFADEFRNKYPGAIINGILFNNRVHLSDTDLNHLDAFDLEAINRISDGDAFRASSPEELKQFLQEILVPHGGEITDVFSKYVTLPDRDNVGAPENHVKVTMKVGDDEITLWENGSVPEGENGAKFTHGEGSKAIIQSVTFAKKPSEGDLPDPPTASTGTLTVTFDPDYPIDKNAVYTVSYDVQVTNATNEATYPHTGDSDTDYTVTNNSTSSGKPGFYSNDEAYVEANLGKGVHRDYYPLPVVQGEKISFTVVKKWGDEYNKYGMRPESVTMELQSKIGEGGWTKVETTEQVTNPATLNSANRWTYTWSNLPETDQSNSPTEIQYQVIEVLDGAHLPNYFNPVYGDVTGSGSLTQTVTNNIRKTEVLIGKYSNMSADNTETQTPWNDGKPVNGAQFSLVKADNDWTELTPQPEGFPKTAETGSHSISGVSGSQDGIVAFVDLINGHYLLTETEAPAGYVPSGDGPWQIDVKDDGYTVKDKNGNDVNTHAYGNVSVPAVINRTGPQLPSTGGVGIYIYLFVGLLLSATPFVYVLQRAIRRYKEIY